MRVGQWLAPVGGRGIRMQCSTGSECVGTGCDGGRVADGA